MEYGTKYLRGENAQFKKTNFTLFYNQVILGDNTILVLTDQNKTAYINYDVLNYMMTNDEAFAQRLMMSCKT